jgi:hypothetical protein
MGVNRKLRLFMNLSRLARPGRIVYFIKDDMLIEELGQNLSPLQQEMPIPLPLNPTVQSSAGASIFGVRQLFLTGTTFSPNSAIETLLFTTPLIHQIPSIIQTCYCSKIRL